MLPLGVVNLVMVAIVAEMRHPSWLGDRLTTASVCAIGWIVALVGWMAVAFSRPLIADNRPLRPLVALSDLNGGVAAKLLDISGANSMFRGLAADRDD